MLTHAELAAFAGRSYSAPRTGLVALDVRYDLISVGNERLVVIPGTHPADLLDWIRDLRAWPWWAPRVGFVHSGFGKGGEALYQRLRVDLVANQRSLAITGHSLGGALAQYLAAKMVAEGCPPQRLVTFGAPRVGWLNPYLRLLTAQIPDRAFYQRAGDLVPTAAARCLGFNHSARGVSIGLSIGNFIVNHSIAQYAVDLTALGL